MTTHPYIPGVIDRRRLLLTVLSTALASSAAPMASAAEGDLLAAARKEGQVVAYGDPTFLPLLVAGFSKAYPDIKVTSATIAGSQAYYRYLAEKQAGRTIDDIIYTGEDAMILASNAGDLQKYRPAAAADMLSWAISPEDTYALVHTHLCLILYNSDAMKGLPLPKDWMDFANPPKQWQNLIITADPRNSSAAYTTVAALYQHYGAQQAGLIFQGLKKAGAELSPNMGPQTAKLMSGERPLSPTMQTSYMATMLRDGAPIKMIVPASGAVLQSTGMGITKDAPHPNAARLFMEYSLSPAGQAIIVGAGAYSDRKDAATPSDLPPYSLVKIMHIDLPKAVKDRKEILKWWQTELGINS